MPTSDLSVDLASEIGSAIFKNEVTAIQPVANVYVTLFDALGNELDADLENGRVETSPADWTELTGSSFENAATVDFGEALADIDDIAEVALFDDDTAGTELARYDLEEVNSVAENTRVFFEVGQLDFDVLDRTQA